MHAPPASVPVATVSEPAVPSFEREELQEFDADDTKAGRAIGRMLSTLFIYTLIAMSLSALWTFRSITQ